MSVPTRTMERMSSFQATAETEWTNSSVLEMASESDPVRKVSAAARDLVLRGIDRGWDGPPYDPFELAHLIGTRVRPTNLRADARTVLDPETGDLVVEYNPARPASRVRFSVAHELGHLLFPDVGEQVRRRTTTGAVAEWAEGDDW